ncbi:MAG: nucleotidyl transferase AbiEii/AbiGii toxin family protein [Gemmatimonas sp.]|nr:nucleotidyl transferase AbiEii/AbiGii toxin family protein [Gemmatimonas sp.]
MSPPRRGPSNLPASIHARLLRLAKESDANFNVVLVRFATERLLYRLSRSPHADRFVLKGAWLFYVWDLDRRVTRDLDLLGFGDARPAAIEEVFRDVLASPVEPDGIEFDDAQLQVAEMREGAAYPGVRVRVVARLGNARIPFQVDVGFGDAVLNPPPRTALPTLLDLPAPELDVYPVEAVVAEKVQAMVRLDVLNTRLKDYFDLYVLATEVTIDAASLARQIAQTFQRRGTAIPAGEPAGLSDAFASEPERNARWRAFLERSGGAASAPASFPEVVDRVRELVLAPLEAVRRGG